MRIGRTLAASLAAAILLAGCSGRDDPEAVNEAEEPVAASLAPEPAPPPPAPPEPEVAPPANEVAPPANEVAPLDEETISEDEQMREDADATGLTARIEPREEEPAAANVEQDVVQ